MSNGHKYTIEQIDWLSKKRPLFNSEILTALFNIRFKTSITKSAIKGVCQTRGFKFSGKHRYIKGETPWNLGKKGYMGANITSFTPGTQPPNHKPVGSERITKEGYVEIKTEEGRRKWMLKHRWIYEQHNGPIGNSNVIVLLDNDKSNCDISNLEKVSRGELALLNKFENFSRYPPEIKKALIAVVRLEQTSKRVRNERDRKV